MLECKEFPISLHKSLGAPEFFQGEGVFSAKKNGIIYDSVKKEAKI